MNSSTLKLFLFKFVLLFPSLVVLAMCGVLVLGTWVTAVLKTPESFDDAPAVIQQLTRSIYLWNVRVMWQQQSECIEFDPDTLYRPRPGACSFDNVEFSTITTFDDRGVRLTKPPPSRSVLASTAPRLIVVGDSFAMGWGVSDEETFASVISGEYGFHVSNLAVSSFGTAREMRRLEKLGEFTPGDVLIIQYCDNDHRENAHFLEHGQVGPYTESDLDAILSDRRMSIDIMSVSAAVFRNLGLAAWERALEIVGRDEASTSEGKAIRSPGESLVGILQRFGLPGNHKVIVVPVNEWGRSSHLLPEKDILDSSGVVLVEPVFGADDFFRIDGHLNAKGQRVVAEAIVAAITQDSGDLESRHH